MLGQCAAREGLKIWAYCLMGNHVHLVVVPGHKDALARGIGLCHQRYASAVNARNGWTGNLWANRFTSGAGQRASLANGALYRVKPGACESGCGCGRLAMVHHPDALGAGAGTDAPPSDLLGKLSPGELLLMPGIPRS